MAKIEKKRMRTNNSHLPFCYTNLMKTLLEKILFILINIIFCFNYCTLKLLFYLCSFFVQYINKSDIISYNKNGDFYFILWILVLYLIYIFLKLFLFSILYKLKNKLPYIHSFLKNFLEYKKTTHKILKISFMFDVAVFVITTFAIGFKFENAEDFWIALMQGTLFDGVIEIFCISLMIYIFLLGGVTTSYLAFLLIYKLTLKNKI